MTARRLRDLPDAADPAVGQAASLVQRAALVQAPSLVRPLGVQRANGALWLVSELDDGVWLSRLLELTRPRPAQALVIGLGVLCGLRAVHAAGYAHDSVCTAEVRVGDDGQARLDGWAAGVLRGPELLEQRQRADVTSSGVLLTQLARAARRSTADAVVSSPALLAALDAAARYAAFPAADVELVAGPLEAVCGPDEGAAVRSELAALVRAVTVRGSGLSSSSSSGTTLEPPAGLTARVRELWTRIWTWVIALTVLVAVVSAEFALLHEWLARDVRQLQHAAGQPGKAAASGQPVPLPPVPSPAPASAGIIRGIDLRALQPCTAGAACVVRVLVTLQPKPQQPARQPAPHVVRWDFQVVDRCTGSQRSVPGGVVSLAPRSAQVQAVSTVPLPPGRALGVIAVTSEPAKAASEPLRVPARGAACPGN